ncbi:hypothetical protein [Mesorhizobium sp.]|uniref:hypothetical protein n=1 Tax=Mesorhizobium sp. TaxID=1871066 RepID=UPI000FE8CA49|nr:hypothetical protein [Mesorhizobium sp.]RWQ61414.1 MAG: hypothetical protein EOS86_33305 [Mesorhizobium sp.]
MEKYDIAQRIELFDGANGGGVGWYKGQGACHGTCWHRGADRPSQADRSGSPTGYTGENATSTIWAACPAFDQAHSYIATNRLGSCVRQVLQKWRGIQR